MSLSTQMIEHLQQGTTYLAHLLRVEERPRELPIFWADATAANVAHRGGYLKKTGGTSGSEDAGAASIQSWAGDIQIQATLRQDGDIAIGLDPSTSGLTIAGTDYCIALVGSSVRVYESGTLRATSGESGLDGDHIMIRRVGSAITYYHNRALIYTSAVSASGTYYAKGTIKTARATIEGAVFAFVPTVIRVTDHTRKITFDSETYTPLPMLPTQFNRSEGLRPDNAEITHVLRAGGVTEADLIGGRWDGARFEFRTVNYLDLTMGIAQCAKGRLGEFRVDTGRFSAELRSLAQQVAQPIGGIVSSLCSARRLGGLDCGQPMDAYIHDAAISSVTNSLTFVVNLSPAKANNYFRYGRVYFRDGDNQFYEREIKGNTGNTIELARPFPFLPEAADLVTLVAGCARTRAACKTFVNANNPSGTNIENFLGFPDVPGNSKVYRYPE